MRYREHGAQEHNGIPPPSFRESPGYVPAPPDKEIESFADQVSGVSNGPTTGESERLSLAIVQAGYESARIGHPVNLVKRFGDIF